MVSVKIVACFFFFSGLQFPLVSPFLECSLENLLLFRGIDDVFMCRSGDSVSR